MVGGEAGFADERQAGAGVGVGGRPVVVSAE